MDFVKLTKLMMLTASNADGEALNAIRIANRMLTGAKLNWEQVLKVRLAGPELHEKRAKSEKVDRKAVTRQMLNVCLENVQGPAAEFIESLEESFVKYGSLTAKQMNALKKFYDRIEGN